VSPEETFSTWFGTSWAEVGSVALSVFVIFGAVIIATRIGGLRSFSKMSAFDFAMTVAVGSLIATVSVTDASLPAGLVGLAVLYGLQVLVAVLRRRTGFEQAVDNTPVLLMRDGEFFEDAMQRARVTRSDLRAKLREANALRYADVRAVVLETTGDISVLHGDGELEPDLLRGVQGSERLLGRDGGS
jgi:uncharacterized membrane protein YcaP (DUF421 family)